MRRLLIKFISFILVFNLFFIRGFTAVSQVFGQSTPAPTSAPAPTSPPSEAKPTTPPQSTSAPASTSVPKPTSAPMPISAASSTSSPEPTAGEQSSSPTPTVSSSGDYSTGTNQETGSGSEETTEGESVNDPANIATGPYSNNNASEILDQKYEALNKNLAELQNKIDAISTTGFNYADLNTLDGQVFTGNSLSTLNLLNKLNSNLTGVGGFSVFNIYDTYLGDIIFNFSEASNNVSNSFDNASTTVAKNALTGPGSTNIADASNSFTVKEASGNDAKIVNDIVLESVTGGNSASFNTGGGSVKTGNALASGNIINMANTNLNVSKWLFGVVNIFGTLAGNIILPQDTGSSGGSDGGTGTVLVENTTTGSGSTNDASYENQQSESFETDNTALVTSNVDVSANTGNNSASVNTGGGSVSTGVADASISNTTIANTNTVDEDGTVWMIIVNEAGKWVGHIIGEPWGTTAASNTLPINQETGGSGTQTFSTLVDNSATGPMSDNSASYSNSSDISNSTNNTASIENNIQAVADSGNNEAAYNTGKGEIETGNAKVGLNLVNMVNTNVTAKKFVAVLVNVLGTFLGDVIPPDQQSSQEIASSNTSTSLSVNPQSVTPTPTTIQYSSNLSDQANSSSTISDGGTGGVDESVLYTTDYDYDADYVSTTFVEEVSQTPVQQTYISQPRSARTKLASNYRVNSPNIINLSDSTNSKLVTRGTFLSPAFAKATETTFPGILLGGARLKVDQSWLSIVPVAFLLILLRRRRKIQFTKYLNALLEIVL